MRAVTVISLLLAAANAANAQGVRWFQPNAFDLSCKIEEKCAYEEKCTAHDDQLTIRHQIHEGPTYFTLPEGVESSGVLGVVDAEAGHSLLGSASPDGEVFFRISVFAAGDLVVTKSYAGDRAKDVNYYGTCVDRVG